MKIVTATVFGLISKVVASNYASLCEQVKYKILVKAYKEVCLFSIMWDKLTKGR